MVRKRDGISLITLVVFAGCVPGPPRMVSPTTPPSAVPTETASTWIKTFEGPGYGAFFDIAISSDGYILAVGATNHLHVPPYSGDALLMKLSTEGDALWERTWGGEGYEQAVSVALDEDDGYYVFGETDSYGAGDRDFFLLKLDENGTADWFRTYGRVNREWPYGMLPLSNGELLLYGFSEPEVGRGRRQYVIRVGGDGDPIWEYIGESAADEFVLDALETGEGGLVLAVCVEEDAQLVMLDPGGDIQWTQRYEIPGWQFASQIAPAGDGGFLLAGFTMDTGSSGQADTWLARSTSDGEMLWETSFGNPAYDDYATSMVRLGDGSFLIGAIGNGMLLTRVNGDAKILWERSLVGDEVFGVMSLLELKEGGFLVAGLIQRINGRSYDAILVRTNADGRVIE
jgi:hypothetical protein